MHFSPKNNNPSLRRDYCKSVHYGIILIVTIIKKYDKKMRLPNLFKQSLRK
jgi:hypothetical protein